MPVNQSAIVSSNLVENLAQKLFQFRSGAIMLIIGPIVVYYLSNVTQMHT